MIQVYNTMTRTKEDFVPLNHPEVTMYLCGPTVYDLLHVGNFRGAVFYNLVRNWLEHSGYQVKVVYNYTDVDDKIINRSNQDGVTPSDLANRYVEEFQKDFRSLKLKEHFANPKVSETMPEIIQFISELITNGKAYAAGNGDVWYSISSFSEYGKLSNRKPEELLSGVRIETDEHKKSALDFALWKHAKAGEPSWDSPWGKGRPGWHIECSAMAKKHLGDQIDIHGGGLDLMFPHHENEIAQSEGVSHKCYAKYWMHNNMINFGGAKMSKSLGNIRTCRSFVEEYNPEILKFMILSVHYRSISDLSEENILSNIKGLARIYSALAAANNFLASDTNVIPDPVFVKLTSEAWSEVEKALNDDFNTPEAFAKVFDVIRQFNTHVKFGMKVNPVILGKAKAFHDFVLKFGALMSLFQEPAKIYLNSLDDMLLKRLKLERDHVERLVQERWQARVAKDFKKSDELRDQLVKMGISVMDTSEGSFWEVTK
jgi:cysteinyl-tRNA synthetase